MTTARLRKILLLTCPTLSSLCLGIGCLPFGAWAALIAVLAFGVWLAARRWKSAALVNLGLAGAALAGALGLTVGASLIWMFPGVALALASWDVYLLDVRLASNPPGAATDLLEKTHYASLGLVLGLSLLVVVVGQMIRFRIPFVIMLALVLLAYFSIDRLLRSLAGK